MRTDRPPPAPGTGHPAYSDDDQRAVRHWLDETDLNHFMLGRSAPLAVIYGCEDQAEVETASALPFYPDTRMFHRVFAVTPAPWAGREYAYVYSVGLDDLGRAVAGVRVEPAYLDHVPADDWPALMSSILRHRS
jgi:hypothetical protein